MAVTVIKRDWRNVGGFGLLVVVTAVIAAVVMITFGPDQSGSNPATLIQQDKSQGLFQVQPQAVLAPSYKTSISEAQADEAQQYWFEVIIQQAIEADFSPPLALAMAAVGSEFKPHFFDNSGARGLFALLPEVISGEFGIEPYLLFDGKTNLNVAMIYMTKLLNQYDQQLDFALWHYRHGVGLAPEAIDQVFVEPFVDQVMRRFGEYRQDQKVQIEMSRVDMPQRQFVMQGNRRQITHSPVKNVVSQRYALDDFADPNSRLNKFIALQGTVNIHDRQLSPARQHLVNDLATLRRHNLDRRLSNLKVESKPK